MTGACDLPIEPLLPQLRQTLNTASRVVLQAPPGAGKTTRIPLALLQDDWLEGRRILMLEPRRLAARNAARFMAHYLGERVGETVGYRVSLDSRVGPTTRIEVVTEGILTRMLQDDQALEGVGLVIFDEFHERSLQADLGLALSLDSQATLRDDLRILVMSATLDGAAVARLLGGAPLLTSEGRSHPVTTRYRPLRANFARQRRSFCSEVASRVGEVLREERGSLLVFLPGVGEILQVESALRASAGEDLIIAPLHGQLDARAQETAIQPAPAGKRKLVLTTSIAETSLTIEGIRVVVDAGLMRRPRFDPGTGLSRLETVSVSQAAADQRRGRAGRLEAGVCYRLWPEGRHLLAHTAAEILEADLAPLRLELARWGVHDAAELAWLDPPPAAQLAQAEALLQRLGALDDSGRITPHGHAMARLGAHPRLAHMMIRGSALGRGALACELAALLGERDPLRSAQLRDTDVRLRLEALRGDRSLVASRGALKRIRAIAERWRSQLGVPPAPADDSDLSLAGVLLAFAYPDRIGLRRPGSDGRYRLSSGRGAHFSEAEPLAAADMIVAAFLDGGQEARIFLAAAVTREQLLEYHPSLFSTHRFVGWDRRQHSVQARSQQRLGKLVLTDEAWSQADTAMLQAAMLEGIRHSGLDCLPWNEAARQLQARIGLLRGLFGDDWPRSDDATLTETLEHWLAPYLQGITRRDRLKRLDLHKILLGMLSWQQRRELERLAPTHLQVPSGSRIRLDYSQETPVLAVRLQEMFGLAETPRIAGGRVPVLLQLLSPAQRPLQLTQDLGAFWEGSYREVRKEMRGRYPKHHWPDDPLRARATTRTRKKR